MGPWLTAATALPSHIKNGFVRRSAVLPAIAAGLAFSSRRKGARRA